MTPITRYFSRQISHAYSAGKSLMRPWLRGVMVLATAGVISLSMAPAAQAGLVGDVLRNMPADPIHAENPANDLKPIHFECLNCPPGQRAPGEPLRGSNDAGLKLAGGLGALLLAGGGAAAIGRRREKPTSEAPKP